MSQESDSHREMRPEYDIRGGVRGKFFDRYHHQETAISIIFDDSELIAKGTAGALHLGHVTWSVSYQSPNPSPTVQLGGVEPAESRR
jgi:hypothetical protein